MDSEGIEKSVYAQWLPVLQFHANPESCLYISTLKTGILLQKRAPA